MSAFGQTMVSRDTMALREKIFYVRMALFKEYFIDTTDMTGVMDLSRPELPRQYSIVKTRYEGCMKMKPFKKKFRRVLFVVWSWFGDLNKFRFKVMGDSAKFQGIK